MWQAFVHFIMAGICGTLGAIMLRDGYLSGGVFALGAAAFNLCIAVALAPHYFISKENREGKDEDK